MRSLIALITIALWSTSASAEWSNFLDNVRIDPNAPTIIDMSPSAGCGYGVHAGLPGYRGKVRFHMQLDNLTTGEQGTGSEINETWLSRVSAGDQVRLTITPVGLRNAIEIDISFAGTWAYCQ